MPIQIEIHDSHIQPLIDFYVNRLKTLRNEIVEREKEMKDVTQTIQKLKKTTLLTQGNEENTIPSVEYSDKWTWVRKIEFAISFKNKPLTTKEIVDVLTEFEPSFLFDRKRVVASISSTLSTRSGSDKEFERTTNDNNEFAYYLQPPEGSPRLEPIDDLPF